jgi:hypothetical protein
MFKPSSNLTDRVFHKENSVDAAVQDSACARYGIDKRATDHDLYLSKPRAQVRKPRRVLDPNKTAKKVFPVSQEVRLLPH